MSLRLIMAVSADGYLASGLNDDMSWTGQLDKTIFKLLTSVGGVVGAGHNTFWQLPHLSGRRLVCLMDDINGCGPRYFRKGIPPSCVDLVDDWDACAPAYAPRSSTMHDVMDVVQFARLVSTKSTTQRLLLGKLAI